MSETPSPHQPSGWRTSKACQECRKRKIKCDGVEPCLTCRQRRTPCIYRNIVRQRQKKQRSNEPVQETGTAAAQPIEPFEPGPVAGLQPPIPPPRDLGKYKFHNNSVSATQMASPSCKVQLYYGPTAHFAMLQQIYRELVSNQATQPEEPQGEVEEASAGLDLFSFRRIFFGTLSEAPDLGRNLRQGGMSTTFLSYDLAKEFFERFMNSLYALMPVRPRSFFERQLNLLYQPALGFDSDAGSHALILLALAIGSLGTEHSDWGEVLFERAKIAAGTLDEVHAHYQMDQGRPNSSFLHLGIGARKAIAAGLHKDTPSQEAEEWEVKEERRKTFWYFYFYESWVCFHLGRPSSLSLRDVNIACPDDPFLRVLLHLGKAVTRSANEIYGQRHDSLLQMWKIAWSITNDLREYDALMHQALGFGLEKPPQTGPIGVRQTILTTLYYHVILLTFRPFLIFRGRLQRDAKAAREGTGSIATKPPTEIPEWMNEACANVLNSASRTIYHLYLASPVNELVREIRYHGFFLGSASFALIYGLMHDETASTSLLPWIHAGIWCLWSMRRSEPIDSSISALQSVLKKINPSYEWVSTKPAKHQHKTVSTASLPTHPSAEVPASSRENYVAEQMPNAGLSFLPDLDDNMIPGDIPVVDTKFGNGEDLLDLTQSDIGWDFDLSNMDLEEFFSVYPPTDIPNV